MKKILLLLISSSILMSCSSLKVYTDYDDKIDFNQYKTFAFYKPEIDKAKISDLDKKRILRAIESELLAKGFTKSDQPDMLVGIFTKSRERVNVSQNNNMGFGWGWGWNPWMMGGMNNVNVNQFTEGTLFIDFIDKEKKELIWQGVGSGALRLQSKAKKEARIKEFVKEIITRFPPDDKNK
ncbi:DUF4136 domain-containing protein [Polaribacter septentrionalilitoris]|uniref:DUF4136 domain-containing protein n=1 Tax=Polaribacter septentrionalilitoris TaxID=2494657 RepID=UPI00135C3C84|nr:DUF4136 domain-containing protein [Polaribacter septentrionalilitoris]